MKKIIKTLVLLIAVPFLLSGCSEVEFGSHLYKTWGDDSSYHKKNTSSQSSGTFKVGNPYTVLGRTYYPRETYSYTETGISSWYGPGFHGKKTASGETYSQYEMTAAHRTLQMPSLVRVTNLSNGKSVVVRVNDRGPFAKGRIIDVSERAAGLLGMKGAGTAKVKLELLANESRALAQAAKNGKSTKGVEVAYNKTGHLPKAFRGPVISDVPMTENDITQTAEAESVSGHVTGGHFYPNPVVEQQPVTATSLYVQVGAFGQESNARNLAVKMASIASTKVEPVTYGGKTLYKVRLGPLDSVRTADSVLSKVLSSGQSDAIIIVQ
ncbi:MAG TPA: septal ring lytic transglycosylase RlpA family protein [Alphaproteobacteria bacterium]|nr:septal ring lytic transglycosylase RlpA family protein [Alphaproteobacteria bacterium]